MSLQRKQLGNSGEQIAKDYLINKGYQFVTQNFRTRFGEIDLIFIHQHQLVLVEVKTRQNNYYGYPEEAVNQHKLNQIYRVGEAFMQKNPNFPQSARVEIISITVEKDIKISHLDKL